MPQLVKPVPELSVVVLCYRAGYYIQDFVAQLEKELEEGNIDFELILVANYEKESTDDTPAIVTQMAESKPRFKVISKEKKGRMGWDMRSGLEGASGSHIAVIDGDGQMPVSDVVKVYRMLLAGNYDLTKTYRAQRHDGFYRTALSAVYNVLFKMLYMPSYPLHDINSKPKVMTREAYQRFNLVSSDWFTDAEIMIEALNNKLKIGELSTIFYENERRKTLVGYETVVEFIYNLFYYRFFKKK
jgi:glycosyltransferase involved in cell wall biosynthesis